MGAIRNQLLSGQPFWSFPRRANAATVRIVAGLSASGVIAAIVLGERLMLLALAIDFALRAVGGPRLSPLARLALWLAVTLKAPMTTVAGAPKQIAAMVGTTLLSTASALAWAGLPTAGWVVAGMVALFATLEAVFALCVACRIYDKFIPCPDCVRGSGEGI